MELIQASFIDFNPNKSTNLCCYLIRIHILEGAGDCQQQRQRHAGNIEAVHSHDFLCLWLLVGRAESDRLREGLFPGQTSRAAGHAPETYYPL